MLINFTKKQFLLFLIKFYYPGFLALYIDIVPTIVIYLVDSSASLNPAFFNNSGNKLFIFIWGIIKTVKNLYSKIQHSHKPIPCFPKINNK